MSTKCSMRYFEVLAEANSLDELKLVEPKARKVYTRYLEGLNDAKVGELAIHRRVSRLKHLRRCAEASSVQAHMKQASPGPWDGDSLYGEECQTVGG